MSVEIKNVINPSAANSSGIRKGDFLISINGHGINDVLDYNFYATEKKLSVVYMRGSSEISCVINKKQYADLGLEFETYLMDRQRSCANNCIFCFVDQNPRGMRKSLYFKDDDVRLSFLLGNYVTLTNFSQRDIDRIVEMKISPINISVHTTDPELRCKMLGNKNAGKCLSIIDFWAENMIKMNIQIVVCPGYNDGEALENTLHDLVARYPAVSSIAVVPVGITKYREGLTPLKPVDINSARSILQITEKWSKISSEYYGERRVFAADELYLKAGFPLPPDEDYEDYPQLENGVGMLSLFRRDFYASCNGLPVSASGTFSVATGAAAAPLFREIKDYMEPRYPSLKLHIYEITNNFFGDSVTVAGLLTGQDLRDQLKDKDLGGKLFISESMLKNDEDIFLDDMSLSELSSILNIKIVPVKNSGEAFINSLIFNEGVISG